MPRTTFISVFIFVCQNCFTFLWASRLFSNLEDVLMSQRRILFVMKQKQGQSLYVDETNKKPGLSNGIESLVNTLTSFGFDAHIRYVEDRNRIDAAVHEVRPDVVIIEAYWVTPGKLQFLKVLHPKVHWIVRNHSEVPFLAQEGNAGEWNCEYLKMGVEIASVSTRTVEDLNPLVRNLNVPSNLLSYLPNVYFGETASRPTTKSIPGKDIHIACFGAVRSMKNHLEQAMAAIGYATKTGRNLFFHINGTRIESNGSQPLKNLQGTFARLHNADLVQHPWMDKSTFYKLMEDQIDVVLQCSLTESFNIVAADAVLCSVPVIASPEIRWLGAYSHANATSVNSIIERLEWLFGGSDFNLSNTTAKQYRDLKEYNERALDTWIKKFA